MNDIRIDVKVKNNRLISIIEEQHGSVGRFCVVHDLNPSKVGEYVNLKESPLVQRTYEWKKTALDIADALGVLPDELWPEHMQQIKLATNKGSTAVSADQVAGILGSDAGKDPLLGHLRDEKNEALHRAMATLTDKEATVLKMRFGLEDGEAKTLKEIGSIYDLSVERIRHIEAKALRKLRHPSKELDREVDEVVVYV